MATISALKYTQTNGFSAFADVEDWAGKPWADGDSEDIWLRSAGFGCPDRYGVEYGVMLEVYGRESGEYLCVLSGTDANDYILVENRASLMALRIALAPLVSMGILDYRLEGVMQTAERSFLHTHNHEPMYSCRDCETEQEQRERRAREARTRERVAKLALTGAT